MYLKLENSASPGGIPVPLPISFSGFCRLCGIEVIGCVCGGVKTGADLSDLCGKFAPKRWNTIKIYKNNAF